jgi:hypothetical protein
MKKVSSIPAPDHVARRDPWFDELFDGGLWELGEADWKARYGTVRSASSAVKQAAVHRGITAEVAIRGDKLFVRASSNGSKPSTAKKVPAKKAAAKKATPRKRASTKA